MQIRRRPLTRAAACVAIALAMIATMSCSLIAGFDGFVGAALDASPEGAAEDGGKDSATTSDAASLDANSDASETSVATDAAPPVDAAFCGSLAPAPKFCDDFERVGNVQGAWSSSQTSASATLTIQSDEAGSYLHAAIPAGAAANSDPVAQLFFDLATTKTKYTITWRSRFTPAVGNSFYAELVDLEFPSTGYNYREVIFANQAPQVQYATDYEVIDGGDTYAADDLTGAIKPATWQSMSLAVDLSAPSAVMIVDGTQLENKALPGGFAPATFQLQLGLNFVENANATIPAYAVDFDDVTVDY